MSPTATLDPPSDHPAPPKPAPGPGPGTSPSARPRPPLSPTERRGLVVAATATVGFAGYGLATGAPSTLAYVTTVVVIGAVVVRLRQAPLPPVLAWALALLTGAHLAGGLVAVGDGVLYNAHFASPVLQYDHLVHASAVFVGTLVLSILFTRREANGVAPPSPVLLVVLAGMGLGAINETVEFLTTIVNQNSHVGGYVNTGWDLVSNTLGTLAAGLVIARGRHRR